MRLSLYALGRLIWRPASLMVLYPMVLVIAMPLFPPASTVTALWRENAVVILSGLFCTMVAAELKRGFFTWTIPGIDSLLVRGFAIVAVVLTLPIAVTSAVLLGAEFGIAFLGAGVLFFALGTELKNELRPANYRRAVMALLGLALWRPDYVHRAILVSPVLFGAVAAFAGFLIFRQAASPNRARERPFFADPTIGIPSAEALRNFWSKKQARGKDWVKPLFDGTVIDWVSAAYYETFNARLGGWARMAIGSVGFGVAWAYAFNGPWFMMMTGSQAVVFGGLQLRTNLIYPLSREMRAKVFYRACLLENTFISGLSAILIWGLYTFGPGHINFLANNAEEVPAIVAAGYAASMFVFMPIAQWAKINGPLNVYSGLTLARSALKAWGFMIAFLVVQTFVTFPLLIHHSASQVKWILVPVGALAIQGVYWFAVQRHFRRADIVIRGER